MKKHSKKRKSNFSLLFTPSKRLTPKGLQRKKKLKQRLTGLTLVLLQLIISIIFMFLLIRIDILPSKYMIAVISILILFFMYTFISQYTRAHKMGKFISLLLSIVLLAASFYAVKTNAMLFSIAGNSVKSEYFSVIVLNSDPAHSVKEAKGYSFAYNETVAPDTTQTAIEKVNEKTESTISTKAYSDWKSMINSLYRNTNKAIIINEEDRDDIQEAFSDFNTKTRVIDTVKLEKKFESPKSIVTKPFSVYISGNDTFNELNSDSKKSDVNIIATFNPKTRQILLVSTPRDSYIDINTLSEKGVKLDKLTHSGNFGIDSSMTTLKNLYGIDIDYYVRINFSGTIKLVDALGGITINSELAFKTHPYTAPETYTFVKGNNECDGLKTLAFCRERYNLPDGDNQRGRDQMLAIKGLVSKASSPALLTKYAGVMDSLSSMFATSMPKETISALVKDMLKDPTPWNVQSFNVTGTSAEKPSTIYPKVAELKHMSVTILNESSVHLAEDLMQKIKNGEVFDVDSYVSSNDNR